MEAIKVLEEYAEGKKKFRGENLCGQSLKGKNLAEADFSGADIRSTDFTGANLRNVNFTNAKAGMQRHWKIFFVIILWLLSVLVGISSVLTVSFVELIFHSSLDNVFFGWVFLIIFVVSFVFLLSYSLEVVTITVIILGITIGAAMIPFVETTKALTIMVSGGIAVAVVIVGTCCHPVSLQGANLTNASFIGADLSEANLQNANLSRAKLVQTQLDKTDFTKATLTGAYEE